jgi:hypothetical protein
MKSRDHATSYRSDPLSCARSFTETHHHLGSGDYKLRPLMVYTTQIIYGHIVRFPFYGFSMYATIRRNATPAYNESRLK